MTESEPAKPERSEAASERSDSAALNAELERQAELLEQQNAIRRLAEGRVRDKPMLEPQASKESERFGLEPGRYNTFGDTQSEMGGGLKKFVSVDNPNEVLVGLTVHYLSGSVDDLDSTEENYVLYPDGNLSVNGATESSAGTMPYEHRYEASSEDPKEAEQYRRVLGSVRQKAEELAAHTPRHEILRPEEQAAEIRQIAEAHVPDEPMSGELADQESAAYGLETGKYDVYADPDRGFRKFVSKEGQDVVHGYTRESLGGNMEDPNRYVVKYAVHANGDIRGKGIVESSAGTQSVNYFYSASPEDSTAERSYQSMLGGLLKDAKKLAASRVERPKKGRFGRLWRR